MRDPSSDGRVRTVLHQHTNSRIAIQRGRKHQRRLPVRALFRVHRRSMVDQSFHSVGAARGRGQHQRSGPVLFHRARVRPGFDQGLDHRRTAVLARHHQGTDRVEASGRLRIRARLNQDARQFQIVMRRRPVQRRHAVSLGRVHVGFLCDQGTNGVFVALLSGIGHASLAHEA